MRTSRIVQLAERTGLVIAALAFTAAWAREDIHRPGIGPLTVGLLLAMVAIAAFLRWATEAPAVIFLLAAVVPYPVSLVGKTPFGVVTAAGGLAVLLAIAAFLLRETSGMAGPTPEAGVKVLLLWMAWCSLSAATSVDPKVTLNLSRQLLFGLPLAYLAGRAFGSRQPAALRLLMATVILVAILAIIQAASGFDPIRLLPGGAHFALQDPGEAYRDGLVRVRVGFYHASDLGRVMVVALPFLLVAAVRRHAKLWIRVGTVLVFIAIALTLTFTIWLAAGAALLVLAAASRAKGRGAVAGLVLAVGVLVVGVGGPVTALVEARLHPTGSSQAEQNLRLALIPASVDYADSHRLLGSGPGNFNLLSVKYPLNGIETPLVDDNSFTTELIEVGYPGAILLILGLAALAYAWWRKRTSPLHAAALAALAGWVVCAATVDALARDAPLLACWLVLGVATGAGQTDPTLEGLSGQTEALSAAVPAVRC